MSLYTWAFTYTRFNSSPYTYTDCTNNTHQMQTQDNDPNVIIDRICDLEIGSYGKKFNSEASIPFNQMANTILIADAPVNTADIPVLCDTYGISDVNRDEILAILTEPTYSANDAWQAIMDVKLQYVNLPAENNQGIAYTFGSLIPILEM